MPPKESPSVTATERTWLTKRPYKRKKKANVPVPAPQAEAPAAAPVPLVAVDKAAASVEATTNNSIQRAELTLEFEILIEL